MGNNLIIKKIVALILHLNSAAEASSCKRSISPTLAALKVLIAAIDFHHSKKNKPLLQLSANRTDRYHSLLAGATFSTSDVQYWKDPPLSTEGLRQNIFYTLIFN